MMYVPPNYVDDFIRASRAGGKKLLARAEAKVRKRGIEVDTVLLETVGRRVADLIIKQAKKWRADLIVLGTHGRRGLSRVVMGSDAELVLRETPSAGAAGALAAAPAPRAPPLIRPRRGPARWRAGGGALSARR